MKVVDKLRWTAARLSVMSPAEVAWRMGQAARARLERSGIGLARPLPPEGPSGRPWAWPLPRRFDAAAYVAAADRVLEGRFDVFALRDAPLGFPPRWNVDPKTGTVAPAAFGKSIDYRDESVVGDTKYLWEPNRHLELVTLAQAWHLAGHERHLLGCRTLLESWFEQCPYPTGPNWTSSLEHGIRLVNWAVAWHLIGGDRSPLFDGAPGGAFRARWLRSVHEHCHFVAGWPSRHSSANNHLIGELLGLFVASLTWPMWPDSARWRARSHAELEHEALLQNAPDGVNREQAIYYQHSVIDMMTTALLFARANGVPFGRAFHERLEAMTAFVADLMDVSGDVPAIGDADDARLVAWAAPPDPRPWRSLVATGGALFGRSDWKREAPRADERTRWLLGDDVADRWDALPAPTRRPVRRAWPEGGYYLLGDRFGEPDELRAVFDCGPLGWGRIAAHGHADALAVTLSAGGRPLLVDPGTYAYHTSAAWRHYFRSTLAHNTVTLDGLDQSVSGGNFLWLRKATARTVEADLGAPDTVQRVLGEHDGYARLPDPAIHRRQVAFDPRSRRLEVTDTFACRAEHRGTLCWHFSDACAVRAAGDDTVVATAPGVRATLRVAGAAAPPRLVSGQEEPPLGWVSRRFDERVPATVALWDCSVNAATKLVTIIEVGFLSTDPSNDR